MRRRFYGLTVDLHLFLGLFTNPVVPVFAVSAPFLIHAWLPQLSSPTANTWVVAALPLPGDLRTLSGRPLIKALKPVLEEAGVHGEVGFIRHLVKEEELIIPVVIPGRETVVSLKIGRGDETIVLRESGLPSHWLCSIHLPVNLQRGRDVERRALTSPGSRVVRSVGVEI